MTPPPEAPQGRDDMAGDAPVADALIERAAQAMRSVLRPILDYCELTPARRSEAAYAMGLYDSAIRQRAGAPEAASADAIDTPNATTPAPTATTSTEAMPDRLFTFLAHGDDDHRAWLRSALNSFFSTEAFDAATLRAEVEGLRVVAEAARDVDSYIGIEEDVPFLIDTGHGEAADAIAKLAAALAALPQPTKETT